MPAGVCVCVCVCLCVCVRALACAFRECDAFVSNREHAATCAGTKSADVHFHILRTLPHRCVPQKSREAAAEASAQTEKNSVNAVDSPK